MPEKMGRQAIDRALSSLTPGGRFFGGEPLLEAEHIRAWMNYTRDRALVSNITVHAGLTINGTIAEGAAWALMLEPELELVISYDGLPQIHNRYRRTAHGLGSAERVLATLKRLVAAEKDVEVILTLRPDTLHHLTSSLAFLWGLGLRRLALSLDLWTQWRAEDLARLTEELRSSADLWRGWLPQADFKPGFSDARMI